MSVLLANLESANLVPRDVIDSITTIGGKASEISDVASVYVKENEPLYYQSKVLATREDCLYFVSRQNNAWQYITYVMLQKYNPFIKRN